MDNGFLKALILVGVLAYIFFPVDLMPGCPIDDIIVLLIGLAARKKVATN